MHDTILLILAVIIVAIGARIVMKVRELSSYRGDEEEERANIRRARLPQELQNLQIDEPGVEKWDSHPPTDPKPPHDKPSDQGPQ